MARYCDDWIWHDTKRTEPGHIIGVLLERQAFLEFDSAAGRRRAHSRHGKTTKQLTETNTCEPLQGFPLQKFQLQELCLIRYSMEVFDGSPLIFFV